ncbi:HypC/HybG/HupF family hydrogenase formation chaperone [Demequina sp.]|uniref:HypC/HybG/HupF family hydrogenase formation chaperone n=1 Tax=Demequina sp. TaxID=2050685 RepID=UPI0025BD7E5E|nr:HypC/HybG/HupF family hydrogenase formation chaperone [Demequina sp.]
MCLGTIAQVVEVHRDGRAIVEHGGRREEVLAMTVADDDIQPGEWVVIHSGFALERITEAQAKDALAIRATDPDTTNHKETAS